jgi:hypothetical protein
VNLDFPYRIARDYLGMMLKNSDRMYPVRMTILNMHTFVIVLKIPQTKVTRARATSGCNSTGGDEIIAVPTTRELVHIEWMRPHGSAHAQSPRITY